LELCTGSGWQTMGVGITAGTIAAFASTTCPTGWSEYTAARGAFLRGIDNGAGIDPSGTRAPSSFQGDLFKSHTHGADPACINCGGTGSSFLVTYTNSGSNNGWSSTTSSSGGAETRPKNVAVTFCQFNGTSNGWNNPLSGGSTSPAGSTGDVQYNAGGAFSADSGNFTYASGLLSAPSISATNISGTVATLNSLGAGSINASGVVTAAGISATSNLTSVTTLYASKYVSAATYYGDGSHLTGISGSTLGTVYGYELITNNQSAGGSGWFFANCSAGKNVLGGACYSNNGTDSTDTEMTSTSFGCYRNNTTVAWHVYAVCAYASSTAVVGGSTGNVQYNDGAGGLSGTTTFTYTGGNVGIGTSTPTNGKLEVQTTSGKAVYAASTANAYTIWSTNSNSGGVGVYGINTNTSSAGALGYGSYGVYCPTGSCGGGAAWTTSSDTRLKEQVKDLPNSWGLAAIGKLRPVTYHWRDAKRDRKEGEQVGFIAQDVKTVFPNLVLTDKGSSTTITLAGGKKVTVQDPMSLKYELLVAPLVKAVQELKADNDNLRAEFEAYKRAHP
jgi:hypothetical protein